MPSVTPPDAVVLGLLLAFAAWGAWQGVLRLLVALGSLVAAFPLAKTFGPAVEGIVVKAASVTNEEAVRVAWVAVFLGALLAGGLLFAVARPLVRRLPKPGLAQRLLAALLGGIHGALLIALTIQAMLLVLPGASVTADVARSRSAPISRAIVGRLLEVLPTPEWLERLPASKAHGRPTSQPRA